MTMSFNSPLDWIGHALTAIGMVASVGIVLYQLGKQHKSSLKLQRNNAKEELKLRVYEILSGKARAFSETDLEASSYARSITRELNSQIYASSIGLTSATTNLRAEHFSRAHYNASSALVELIVAIESWEIAFPAAELFRYAFSSANHDVEEAFDPIFREVIRHLPTDLGELGVRVPQLPSKEKFEELEKKVKDYTDARATLLTYVHDLGVEAQNLLLSKLFKRRVETRKPIDPTYKVVTASNTQALMHYFRTETASGKSWSETQDRVRESVRKLGREPSA